jgi:hypothetical protein
MRRALVAAAVALLAGGAAGCGGGPQAPASPTWVDVQPIIRGQCTGCHGTTAGMSGGGFRFDFYDMAVCDNAARALPDGLPLAQAQATKIWNAITTTQDQPNVRPIMPPPPAPYLADWEWQTIKAWRDGGTPKGTPVDNHAPTIQLYGQLATADTGFDITAVVADADADPVVGMLSIGDLSLYMDRSGAFSAHVDTSSWAAGQVAISAELCDGWAATQVPQLGTITVHHGP